LSRFESRRGPKPGLARGPTMVREPGPNRLLPVAELPAGSRVSSLRRAVWRRCATARILLLGPVSVDSLCTTDLSRWPSRHRSLSALSGRQALPHGVSRPRSALYAGRCQRRAGLAHLRRLRSGVDRSLYALDSTTIDLCLSLFPWAKFRQHKAAVKMHTLLDLHGNIPTFISITDGKVHDVNILDEILPEAGAIYVMDRGYIDFERLYGPPTASTPRDGGRRRDSACRNSRAP